MEFMGEKIGDLGESLHRDVCLEELGGLGYLKGLSRNLLTINTYEIP